MLIADFFDDLKLCTMALWLYICISKAYPNDDPMKIAEKIDELDDLSIGIIDFSKDDAILDAIMWER